CYIPVFCDPLRKVFLANRSDFEKSGYLKGFHSSSFRPNFDLPTLKPSLLEGVNHILIKP
ncbi:MAG: hypothetical protein RBS43_08690, partial [Candidatus Cloacimonas sp.]|nr:hypothetical protein [Candidatus Cloacimonas sp.]